MEKDVIFVAVKNAISSMEENKRLTYEAPITEVVELKLEGIIASSLDTTDSEGISWGGGY